MRKLLVSIGLLLGLSTASATDYTDTLVVTVNGVSSYQHATISLTEQDNETYTLSLKNFKLINGEQVIGVGTISLPDCEAIKTTRGMIIEEDVAINIEAGDDPSVDFWMGPAIGEVPIKLCAALVGDKLQAVIDINLAFIDRKSVV